MKEYDKQTSDVIANSQMVYYVLEGTEYTMISPSPLEEPHDGEASPNWVKISREEYLEIQDKVKESLKAVSDPENEIDRQIDILYIELEDLVNRKKLAELVDDKPMLIKISERVDSISDQLRKLNKNR